MDKLSTVHTVYNRFVSGKIFVVPIVNCKKCAKEFYAKPYWIRNGAGKYCSSRCKNLGSRTGEELACFVCGKASYKTQKQLKRSKSGKFFCSKSCQTKWRNTEFVGSKHGNWRNGEYVYKSILLRNNVSPQCKLCGLNDKRVLAVHHIDKNHKNNGIDNLAWLCHNCHHLVHHDRQESERFGSILCSR